MKSQFRRFRSIAAIAASFLVAGATTLSAQSPALRGRVIDSSQGVLPGTTVTLTSKDRPTAEPLVRVTDEAGRFQFDGLAAGTYTVTFSMPGFDEKQLEGVTVPAAQPLEVVLGIGAFAETVLVSGQAATETTVDTPAGEQTIVDKVLAAIPLARERFEDALPLVPGVVRGPDGLLNMKGARSHESAVLVNGVNASDPVTGHTAVRLPLEAVESLKVHAGVYSAAYGNATGGVTDVLTRPGTDKFEIQVQNFMPRPRIKDGSVRGLDSFTPRVRFSGPISTGKLWFSESMNYRFVRSRIDELQPLDKSEQKLNSFDTLTQIDYAVNPTHHMTSTLLIFPSNIDNLNIDTLHPFDSTPDMKQRGWNASLSDNTVLNSVTTLQSTASFKQFNVAVSPKYGSESLVTVDGVRNNYFNTFDRDSRRYDAASTLTTAIDDRWGGDHLIRIGGQVAHTSFNGIDNSLPILVQRANGSTVRRIDFLGDPAVKGSNDEEAAFIEDELTVTRRLTINGGVRYGHEGISGDQTLSPRFDASFQPLASDKTIVKGGIGTFYDKLALNAAGFEQLQRRSITEFDAEGNATSTVVLQNVIAAGGLRTPKTTTWNVELDQEIAKNLAARIAYRRSRGSRQLMVDRAAEDALVLSSNGRSRSREFEATLRRRFAKADEVNFSYVRSRAEGNLNDFVSLYGDTRNPIIFADEYSRQDFDVPNRFLVWGVLNLPHSVTLAPTAEFRNGFPYTSVDESQNIVGGRNRDARYPNLFTMDLSVAKDVRLSRKQRARVGVQVFNLTGHFNPRDVQNNTASPIYGQFANSPDRQVRAKFTLLF
jgi:hypothetical protein